MSEIDNAIKECDLMIDRIIESDAELKENYAIITSIKGVARQNGAVCLSSPTTSDVLTWTHAK